MTVRQVVITSQKCRSKELNQARRIVKSTVQNQRKALDNVLIVQVRAITDLLTWYWPLTFEQVEGMTET